MSGTDLAYNATSTELRLLPPSWLSATVSGTDIGYAAMVCDYYQVFLWLRDKYGNTVGPTAYKDKTTCKVL
eukprot:406284-Rhodomonas_salina.1